MQHELFLEDLNSTHRKTYSHRDVIRSAYALLDLERALRDSAHDQAEGPMIRYDGSFPTAFLDYAHDALDRYVSATGDEPYVELLRKWQEISKWYLSETPGEANDRVHGDYRVANIFHERANPDRIRVVDLEFAGYGWIHNDLASLLKGPSREATQGVITLVASERPEWGRAQHWRMYQRCRLERGLLDAALVASQRVALSPNPQISIEHATRALSALSILKGEMLS